MTLLLNRSVMDRLLTMEAAMPAVERAFAELELGTATVPQRTILLLPKKGADCFFMPGYLEESRSFGIKVSPYFPDNPGSRRLPASVAVMLLLDDETGLPLALMDADGITALRTGATCGLAAKHLARPDAAVVALIGAGGQAQAQIEAICAARPVTEIRIASRHESDGRLRFAERMAAQVRVPIRVVGSAEEAVRGADVVLVATTASEPVIEAGWLAPGAHVSSIQTAGPSCREVGSDVVVGAKIVCDSRAACLAEAGELVIPIQEGRLTPDQIHADLGELIVGKKAGRENEQEITFFKTVGLAIEDLALARLAYDLARLRGLGQEFDLSA